jgi:hypothetical protein
MRNALVLGAVVLAGVVSCSRRDAKMQPNPGQGYALETTGAVIERADPRKDQDDTTIGEVARRLAGQICERALRCHGSTADSDADMTSCMRVYGSLSVLEVASWQCSPAASRSRAKDCIASLNAEPCEMDMGTKPNLCPTSAACPDETTGLTSPGGAAARSSARASGVASFDRQAAAEAMAAVDTTECQNEEGPVGPSHITVTFAPDGGVLTSALDSGGTVVDLNGTAKGQCIVEKFRTARVPLFEGPPVMVGIEIPSY